jgi:hypothetical protein
LSSAKTVKGNSRKISFVVAGIAITMVASTFATSIPGHGALAGPHSTQRPVGWPHAAGLPIVLGHPQTPHRARLRPGTAAVPGRARAVRASPALTLAAYAVSRHRGPRRIARSLLHRFHWGHRQFRYLNRLWARESGWNRYASNPSSGAYGIPQATPGSVMASAGPHWRRNARTQIIWGMRYIRARYGRPRRAWAHECAVGWY